MGEPEFLKDDGDGEATTRIQPLAARAIPEEATDDTTVVQRIPMNLPRVTWVQRLINWFKRA